MKANVTIIFRKLNDPVPSNWVAGLRWLVEAHDTDYDVAYPLGLAWVTVPPKEVMPPIVDMILVADQYRRCGVATELVKAIEQRWPDVLLTEAISKSGEGFLKSMEQSAMPLFEDK